jgi:hypothetical protein
MIAVSLFLAVVWGAATRVGPALGVVMGAATGIVAAKLATTLRVCFAESTIDIEVIKYCP